MKFWTKEKACFTSSRVGYKQAFYSVKHILLATSDPENFGGGCGFELGWMLTKYKNVKPETKS